MRRKGFSRWEFVIVNAVVIVLGVATFTVATNSRNEARKSSCQNNLKQMVLGFHQYFADFDGRYPLVAVTNAQNSVGVPPYGWFDALQPYIRTIIFPCPASGSERPSSTSLTSEPGYTDYWFNSRLAGVKYGLEKAELPHPDLTICAGDGNDGTENNNSRYNRNAVPLNYAPARRHSGGANYAFADGHVKWLVPEAIAAGPADKNKPTLWPR